MKNSEKIQEILNEELVVYGHKNIKPNVEEDIKDILGIVKYEDHGDEYLIIITENGSFEYGYYKNLRFNNHNYLREPTDEIAGKKKNNCGYIEADEFKVTVTKNGKIRTWEDGNVRCKLARYDSWGVGLYIISLYQFGYKES